MNTWSWTEGTYFTTFIVGARYVTVLHRNSTVEEVVELVLEHVGDAPKMPFVVVSSLGTMGDVFLDHELAELTLGF